MLRDNTGFTDSRVEILSALLNHSEISKDAFNGLKSLVEDLNVKVKDDEAFDAFVARLVGEHEKEEEESTTKDTM